MKKWIAFVAFAGLLPAQALVEHAAAATGGSVGGVAGKKVSDGLSKIFEKVDTTTKKAAKSGESGKAKEVDSKGVPLLQVGPGSPKGRDTSGVVPPPPPARRAGVQTQAPPPAIARRTPSRQTTSGIALSWTSRPRHY